MPDVQNVALGNHPIQIPSGITYDHQEYHLIFSPHCRVPRHSEAVHQGGHQDAAAGLAALVRRLLPVHGPGGAAPGQGQAGVPGSQHRVRSHVYSSSYINEKA